MVVAGGVAEDREEKRVALERALTIDPRNELARKGLKALNTTRSATTAPIPVGAAPQRLRYESTRDLEHQSQRSAGPATPRSDHTERRSCHRSGSAVRDTQPIPLSRDRGTSWRQLRRLRPARMTTTSKIINSRRSPTRMAYRRASRSTTRRSPNLDAGLVSSRSSSALRCCSSHSFSCGRRLTIAGAVPPVPRRLDDGRDSTSRSWWSRLSRTTTNPRRRSADAADPATTPVAEAGSPEQTVCTRGGRDGGDYPGDRDRRRPRRRNPGPGRATRSASGDGDTRTAATAPPATWPQLIQRSCRTTPR